MKRSTSRITLAAKPPINDTMKAHAADVKSATLARPIDIRKAQEFLGYDYEWQGNSGNWYPIFDSHHLAWVVVRLGEITYRDRVADGTVPAGFLLPLVNKEDSIQVIDKTTAATPK